MKNILLLISIFISLKTFSQTTIYSENFENGAPGWNLNTNDLGGVTSLTPNFWIINNEYLGGLIIIPDTPNEPSQINGSPNSYYLHITSDFATSNGIYNACYEATGTHSYFARMDSAISTVGFVNDTLSFWWLCQGAGSAYGTVYYRTSASGAWTNVIGTTSGNLNLHSNWTQKKLYITAFDNQPYLQFAFRFNHANGGSDPAFAIDDIKLTGHSSVNPGPTPGFTVTDNDICEGRCVTFSDTSAGNPTTWSWNFPGGTPSSSTSNMQVVCYNSPGTYAVTLTVGNASGTNSTTAAGYITVHPTPAPPTIIQTGNMLTCNPVAAAYQWYYNGVLLSGQTNQTYNAAVSGYYQVGITDVNGCVATSDSFLFEPNGITGLIANEVQLFPNPFNNTIQLNTTHNIGWQLMNVIGETLMEGTTNKNYEIETQELSKGIYFMRVISGNETMLLRLLKQ